MKDVYRLNNIYIAYMYSKSHEHGSENRCLESELRSRSSQWRNIIFRGIISCLECIISMFNLHWEINDTISLYQGNKIKNCLIQSDWYCSLLYNLMYMFRCPANLSEQNDNNTTDHRAVSNTYMDRVERRNLQILSLHTH